MKHCWAFFLVYLLFSCSEKEQNLPESIGGTKRFVLVLEQNKWQSAMGDSLRKIINHPYAGTINDEPSFDALQVTPELFHAKYSRHRVVLIPVLLDEESSYTESLSEEGIELVRSGAVFSYEKNNLWANNQIVIFALAANEQAFYEQFTLHKTHLITVLERAVTETLLQAMQAEERSATTEQYLKDKKGISMVLPEKYEIAKDTLDVIWLRSMQADADLNIVITSRPYTDTSQFENASLISFRNVMAKKHIYVEPTDTASYMLTETYIKPHFTIVESKLGYTKRIQGLWRIHNYRLGGGSFLSYSFLNESKTKQYYVEGFVFAPEMEKIPYLRRLDASLKSMIFTD